MATVVISIINQKGGVGKTTTTTNLAAALHEQGKSVLVIDNDAQANATNALGINDADVELSIANLMMDERLSFDSIRKVIKIIDAPDGSSISLLPADISLAHVAEQLRSKMAADLRMRKIITLIQENLHFDYILIDCPPSLGVLSINALVASEYAIIPVCPNYFSVKGMSDLTLTIDAVEENLNPSLEIMGVLVANYDNRVTLNRNIADTLQSTFGKKVFNTKIRVNKQIEYAQERMLPVIWYNANCNGYNDYMSLAREVIEHE